MLSVNEMKTRAQSLQDSLYEDKMKQVQNDIMKLHSQGKTLGFINSHDYKYVNHAKDTLTQLGYQCRIMYQEDADNNFKKNYMNFNTYTYDLEKVNDETKVNGLRIWWGDEPDTLESSNCQCNLSTIFNAMFNSFPESEWENGMETVRNDIQKLKDESGSEGIISSQDHKWVNFVKDTLENEGYECKIRYTEDMMNNIMKGNTSKNMFTYDLQEVKNPEMVEGLWIGWGDGGSTSPQTPPTSKLTTPKAPRKKCRKIQFPPQKSSRELRAERRAKLREAPKWDVSIEDGSDDSLWESERSDDSDSKDFEMVE